MAEKLSQDSLLIEGFDPEKLAELQEAEQDNKGWKEVYGAYQNQMVLQAEVEGIEEIGKMTCAIVMVKDVRGIIPLEFFGVNNKRQLRSYIGRKTAFMVKNYDREEEVFTGSRIDAQEQMADIMLRRTEVGDTRPAVVNAVTNHSLYADIGGIQVRIPISEVRYGWIDNLHDEYEEGDHLLVKIMNIEKPEKVTDNDGNEREAGIRDTEVTVSAKALKENPWNGKAQRFVKNNEYLGHVSGVGEYGVFVNLDDGIDSLARHMKFENVEKGDKVAVRILDVDVKKEQIQSRILRIL